MDMQDAEFNKWDFYPLHLKPDEVRNPLLVLKDFFADDLLPGHLERLKQWRNCVLENGYYKGQKNSPAELVCFYMLNLSLIEAAHLLKETDTPPSVLQNSPQPEQEKNAWRDYPKNLSETELQNPLQVVKDFFVNYNLPQYRAMLYEWLEYGLSSSAVREFIETVDLIGVYENLQKLYSAAWVIYQRSSSHPYLPDNAGVPGKKENKTIPLLPVNLYQLDTVVNPEKEGLISKLTSIIKHKVPSVQAVIYLGIVPGQDTVFLLVITANEEQQQASALSSTIEESCRKIATVIALVHRASELLHAAKAGNPFFGRALTCPPVYLSGSLILPTAKPLDYATNSETAANWKRWHRQGKGFLSGAGYYLQTGALNPALFSLHQGVECLLTAIIRAVTGYRVNVHNLSRLLHLTQMFTCSLSAVFNMEDEEGKRLFELLKHAYVNVRYKDGYEVDAAAVDELFRLAGHFLTVAEKVYERYLVTGCL